MIAGLALLDLRGCIRSSTIFRLLGSASFSIYLVNYFAIVIAVRAIQFAGIPLGSNITAFVLASLAICCGLVFHFFADQPLQRKFRTQQWFGFRIGSSVTEPRATVLVGPADYRPVRIRSTSCFTVGMKPFE